MSVIEILETGPFTSVQDRGRFGAQRYGLGTAGAMDQLSLAVAQTLVGGAAGAAAIEIGPLAMKLGVREGQVRLALAGAQRGVMINGAMVDGQQTHLIGEGDVLTVRGASSGVFSYLAFEGGIHGEPVFGSLSVHARSGIGSPWPRPLQAGDRISTGNAMVRDAEVSLEPPARAEGPLRVIPGPQEDYFSAAGLAAFFSGDWKISGASDRMGYRLEGPHVTHSKGHNILSDGIALGAIQIAGNGQPLVLLADRGTTGGYPKIGTILSVDIGRLAQTPVGSILRFERIAIEAAEEIAREQAKLIADLPRRVRMIGGGDLSSEFLLGLNLAGEAMDASQSHEF